MYYRENNKIVRHDNIEHFTNTNMDGGSEISSKTIGLYILYIVLAVVILSPVMLKDTASWIFETNEKKGYYISLILILIITIIVLNCL